jgi:hypothetical protein
MSMLQISSTTFLVSRNWLVTGWCAKWMSKRTFCVRESEAWKIWSNACNVRAAIGWGTAYLPQRDYCENCWAVFAEKMLQGIPAARCQTDSGVRPFWSVRSLVEKTSKPLCRQMHRELLAVKP